MKHTAHQRFPRCARIRTSAEYQAVFSEGSRVSGAYFRLHLAQGEAFPKPRLGIAVSKRVDKSAVARNRIKRVCRDYFRLHNHDFRAAARFSFVEQRAQYGRFKVRVALVEDATFDGW